MHEFLYILAALAAGMLLGTIFFGGLWLTVVKSMSSKTPALWFMGSFLLRTGIVLTGFYYIADGNIKRILVCLLGFIIARILVKRLLPNSNANLLNIKTEITHEA